MQGANFDEMAMVYDSMIDWEPRLKRELPLIREVFSGSNRLLEIGCATGRHTIALADQFEMIGIDINEDMISQAKINTNENSVDYYCIDALEIKIGDDRFKNLDGIIILANSLANLVTEEKVIKFLSNMRELMPEGKIFGQTVYLKDEINYLPLRQTNINGKEFIIQRIMFPKGIEGSTHTLHFNIIEGMEYRSQSLIPLFGISPDKLEKLAKITGWTIKEMYSTYEKDPVVNETGKAQIWVLE